MCPAGSRKPLMSPLQFNVFAQPPDLKTALVNWAVGLLAGSRGDRAAQDD